MKRNVGQGRKWSKQANNRTGHTLTAPRCAVCSSLEDIANGLKDINDFVIEDGVMKPMEESDRIAKQETVLTGARDEVW